MNIRPTEATLIVHFSCAEVDRVDEVESGILVAYDRHQRIVDVTARARAGISRVDLVGVNAEAVPARVTYDASVDALYIDANSADIRNTEEVFPGFIVDFDADGFVRGLEFLNASDFFSDQTMSDIRERATLL